LPKQSDTSTRLTLHTPEGEGESHLELEGDIAFKDFHGLHPLLQSRLAALGYTLMSPVQQVVLNLPLQLDKIICSNTGSGKTLAFLLPILSELLSRARTTKSEQCVPEILVISPTRELAFEIGNISQYLTQPWTTTAVIYGGIPYSEQKKCLTPECSIVVGCPGRIIDLESQGLVDLSQVK